jgi:phenylacetate-CoA ligase
MPEIIDPIEERDPRRREAELFERLPKLLARAMAQAPGWARHLDGIDPLSVTSRSMLARLPVLRKSEIRERQAADPPFAGLVVGGPESWSRIFVSPGPIFETMARTSDPGRGRRALRAAGFVPGDIVLNTFAYHLSPGGFILDEAARAHGCVVIPGGTGNSDAQVEAIAHLRAVGYLGTPDFLKVLIDKAAALGRDIASLRRALVSGGALYPTLREEYMTRGIRVQQCYATAEAGIIAYESAACEGMIVEEEIIVEIVRPGTGDPVDMGEVGEVVVTNFDPVYPMIRLATGDLSAVLPGPSPCGRTNMRIRGWLGRADQSTKVRGLFVTPSQIAEIASKHPELGRLRLIVGREGEQDTAVLEAECAEPSSELAASLRDTFRSVTRVRCEVVLVPSATLPNDGRVILEERQPQRSQS